jgi:hypothetical protein
METPVVLYPTELSSRVFNTPVSYSGSSVGPETGYPESLNRTLLSPSRKIPR